MRAFIKDTISAGLITAFAAASVLAFVNSLLASGSPDAMVFFALFIATAGVIAAVLIAGQAMITRRNGILLGLAFGYAGALLVCAGP